MAKQAKSSREKTTAKAKSVRAGSKGKAAASTEGSAGDAAPSKKISQKFLEAMEKRKAQGGWGARKSSPFGKPPGRRGRRPKANAEYTPENSSEEGYVLESEYERIEYDTGIRYQNASEDSGFSLERYDDFDEELNFDR